MKFKWFSAVSAASFQRTKTWIPMRTRKIFESALMTLNQVRSGTSVTNIHGASL
jgi:hypothetical protein